ncbi:MAG: hypothetical protein ABI658_15620 [Acidimicrobiales bacterium]
MALRDKLAARAQPFLEPGEQITQIFPAQVGPNPWIVPAFGPIIVMLLSKMRVIAVTDRAVLVFNSSKLTPKPTALLQRLPRQTRLGPIEGKIWGKTTIGGERTWVHKRFHKDVQAADAALG